MLIREYAPRSITAKKRKFHGNKPKSKEDESTSTRKKLVDAPKETYKQLVEYFRT